MGPLTYTSTYTEPEAMQLIAHLQEYLKNKVLSVELKNWFHLRPHQVFSPFIHDIYNDNMIKCTSQIYAWGI